MTLAWASEHPLRIDRAGERRESADLDQALAVVVRAGALLARDGRLVELAPSDRPAAESVIYLGRERDRDIVALVPSDPDFGAVQERPGGQQMTELREFFHASAPHGDAGARDRELAATAVAIATWHANHPRCALCGDPTVPTSGGWVRRCERCERDHYPRTDPAVIVAITDHEDRLLLAHASYWSPQRFSHLAGYVEPGESLEQAAHREVFEESGLRIRDLEYFSSQPWPFPASVMVGYRAKAQSTAIAVDGDEITEARFFSREELRDAVEDGTVVLAPPASIARRMIDDWYGEPL